LYEYRPNQPEIKDSGLLQMQRQGQISQEQLEELTRLTKISREQSDELISINGKLAVANQDIETLKQQVKELTPKQQKWYQKTWAKICAAVLFLIGTAIATYFEKIVEFIRNFITKTS
jgi:glycyl-tRNA synthetase beta subunit